RDRWPAKLPARRRPHTGAANPSRAWFAPCREADVGGRDHTPAAIGATPFDGESWECRPRATWTSPSGRRPLCACARAAWRRCAGREDRAEEGRRDRVLGRWTYGADEESCRPDFALALYPGHMSWITTRSLSALSPQLLNRKTSTTSERARHVA